MTTTKRRGFLICGQRSGWFVAREEARKLDTFPALLPVTIIRRTTSSKIVIVQLAGGASAATGQQTAGIASLLWSSTSTATQPGS